MEYTKGNPFLHRFPFVHPSLACCSRDTSLPAVIVLMQQRTLLDIDGVSVSQVLVRYVAMTMLSHFDHLLLIWPFVWQRVVQREHQRRSFKGDVWRWWCLRAPLNQALNINKTQKGPCPHYSSAVVVFLSDHAEDRPSAAYQATEVCTQKYWSEYLRVFCRVWCVCICSCVHAYVCIFLDVAFACMSVWCVRMLSVHACVRIRQTECKAVN
jgi:hypothetical protein